MWDGGNWGCVGKETMSQPEKQAESPHSPNLCSDEGAKAQVNGLWAPEMCQTGASGPQRHWRRSGEGSRHRALKAMCWELAGGGHLRAGQ